MTEPFVCKNFSEMTLGFSIHVFGADPCMTQVEVCLYITQSFSFIGISEIFFFHLHKRWTEITAMTKYIKEIQSWIFSGNQYISVVMEGFHKC